MNTREVVDSAIHCYIITILAILVTIFQSSLALGGQLPVNPLVMPPEKLLSNNSPTKDNDNDPHGSTQKFKQYLKEKYIDITEAVSRVRQTKYGPSGDFFVMGKIAPLNKPDLSVAADKHNRVRIIAKAFMESESALLGNVNIDEIREFNIHDGKAKNGNYTIIYCRRYINDIVLQNSELDIDINDSDNINSFTARLVPVPPEVYEATKKKALPEEKVRSIVEADLKTHKVDLKELQITCQKMAIISKPYVVWKVMSHWVYTINAFTGEIIRKDPNWKE